MIGTGLRRVLSLAAFLSLAVPGLALGQGFNNLGLPIIPLTVVNNFDTTMPVFVYIKGKVNPEDISPGSGIKTDDWFYVKDVSGNIDKIPPLLPDGTFTGRLALNLGTAQTTTLQFPKLNGVRIYFSFGAPTQVCCNRGESNV
ncbi:MAG: hypothetical protein ACREP9_06750 [Candidatus Dormibacteraceae bacterium]